MESQGYAHEAYPPSGCYFQNRTEAEHFVRLLWPFQHRTVLTPCRWNPTNGTFRALQASNYLEMLCLEHQVVWQYRNMCWRGYYSGTRLVLPMYGSVDHVRPMCSHGFLVIALWLTRDDSIAAAAVVRKMRLRNYARPIHPDTTCYIHETYCSYNYNP